MQSYTSDLSQLIESLKKNDPNLEQRQQAGRALLWDKPAIDFDERAALKAVTLPQKPYVYSTDTQ